MSIGKKLLNTIHHKAVFSRRVRVLSQLLSEEIKVGVSVLDVGCGDGSISRTVMELRPQLEFRGIEVMLRPKTLIPVEIFDGRTFPFGDASFDWVTIIDVLHHTDDPVRLAEEATRVARHGIVIKDHLRDGFAAYSTLRFMDWIGNWGHEVRLPYNYLSKTEWEKIFSDCRLAKRTWRTDLGLYPAPFSLVFDRHLHFLATLQRDPGQACPPHKCGCL